jgi:LacI family transcriptional regulator
MYVSVNVIGNVHSPVGWRAMRPRNKVTIKDVAHEAGVSAQTVSRVINNRPDVAPETRARVQNAISDLGYAPNIIARSLIQGRSNTLGVVGFGLELFGPTRVLAGIEHKAAELGFSLLLSLLDQLDPARVEQIINDLLSRQVDGIIWAVPGHINSFEWLYACLQEIPGPTVFLNKCQAPGQVTVAMDNRHGGRLAVEHLLTQDYRRIGLITGPPDWWEAQEREAGWRSTMQEAGLGNLDELKVAGDWSAASGEMGFHTLYARAPDLDAVFACNDQMALGALQAARRLGLNVPADLAVVGFDDIPEAAYFYPALTTVRQNPKKLGALAVERMNSMIQARRQDEAYELGMSWMQPRLIVRQSSIRE